MRRSPCGVLDGIPVSPPPGNTRGQTTIDYLFANVVQAKEITASMIDVNSLDGITLTGVTLQTAAAGKRVVLSNNRVTFYGTDGTTDVSAAWSRDCATGPPAG